MEPLLLLIEYQRFLHLQQPPSSYLIYIWSDGIVKEPLNTSLWHFLSRPLCHNFSKAALTPLYIKLYSVRSSIRLQFLSYIFSHEKNMNKVMKAEVDLDVFYEIYWGGKKFSSPMLCFINLSWMTFSQRMDIGQNMIIFYRQKWHGLFSISMYVCIGIGWINCYRRLSV